MKRLQDKPRLKQKGFTLLEAIVAMVILAGTMLAVYSWINTSLIGLDKARQTLDLEQIVKQARQYLDAQDFTKLSRGQYSWQAYNISWQAQLVEPVKQGKNSVGDTGLYDFGLYKIQLDIYKPGQQLIASYNLKQVQYKKVRSLDYE